MSDYFPHTLRVGKHVELTVNFRKCRKSTQCPTGHKWAVIGKIHDESWKEVIRVDNSAHQGRPEPHIHLAGRVKYRYFSSYQEAYDYVIMFLKKTYPERW